MVDGGSGSNYNMNKKSSTLQRLARWQTSAAHYDKKHSTKPKSLASLDSVHHDDLLQGSLYIVKINRVSVTLFEGWDDEMCCFSILRSEATPLRWSEARFLPGDFEAFDAFDEAGNPPVHLWTRYLQVEVPTNWFALFEEARRKQREWKGGIEEQQHRPSQLLSPHSPPSTNILTDDHQRIISDYALQSSSIPVSSSAAASTNIVDPTADSLLSSVSSLPMDSRPLGLFSDYRSIGDTVTSASTPAAPDFPRPPSTVPGLLDRDELRKHLQDDLDKFQHEPGANNSCDTGGRRPSSTSLSSPPRSEKNYSSNNVLRHHASFTNIASTSPNSNNNSKRQSIHSFFSKHSQKQQ